jgi:uroporphyrinogen-III synthase
VRGAKVEIVEAYRTAVPEGAPARARDIFSLDPKPGWVTFTSSSTVRNFVAAAGTDALAGVRVASIGPVTSGTLREYDIEVTVEAEQFTTEALIEALVRAAGC